MEILHEWKSGSEVHYIIDERFECVVFINSDNASYVDGSKQFVFLIKVWGRLTQFHGPPFCRLIESPLHRPHLSIDSRSKLGKESPVSYVLTSIKLQDTSLK